MSLRQYHPIDLDAAVAEIADRGEEWSTLGFTPGALTWRDAATAPEASPLAREACNNPVSVGIRYERLKDSVTQAVQVVVYAMNTMDVSPEEFGSLRTAGQIAVRNVQDVGDTLDAVLDDLRRVTWRVLGGEDTAQPV